MIALKFDNLMAQAWLRSRLRRTSAREGIYGTSVEKDLLAIRLKCDESFGEVLLTEDEAELALTCCEGKVGTDEGLWEARQGIVDQLKAGLGV